MNRCHREPTLSDTLADPIIQALMAADAVNPEELNTALDEVAHKLRRRQRKRWIGPC